MFHLSMRRWILASSVAALAACGEPSSPADPLSEARQARATGDHQRALTLFQHLLEDPEAAARERSEASFQSVLCLIDLGRVEEGLKRYQGSFETYPAEMGDPASYRMTIRVLEAVARSRAPAEVKEQQLESLLELAAEKHPEHGERFGDMVTRLIEEGAVGDGLRGLLQNPYVGSTRRGRGTSPRQTPATQETENENESTESPKR